MKFTVFIHSDGAFPRLLDCEKRGLVRWISSLLAQLRPVGRCRER